tara:strand:+ start:249 stop:482 length:234 start_codon:yes stop_codon:yes gene_type:complete
MSIEKSLRAMVATKQLEIDKLKRKIKELEYLNDSLHRIAEKERIEQGGWVNGDNTRQRSTKTRKTSKRTSKSSDSDQ